MDWFRFYNETCGDPKIRRLSVEHRWLWVAVLSAGSASPVRGRLLLATDQPVTVDDLMDSAKLDRDAVETGISAFLRQEMLQDEDGVWVISKWDKRQFESDSSTERSRRHRAKKQQAEPEPPAENVADGICRNVPETLLQRSGNAPEDRVQSTETENGGDPPNPPVVVNEPYAAFAAICEAQNTDPHVLSNAELRKQLTVTKRLLIRGETVETIGRCTGWMVSQGWRDGGIDAFAVEKALPGWKLKGCPPSAPARAAPKRGGARGGEMNGADWMREIERSEQHGQHRGNETHGGNRGTVPELSAG